VIDSKNILLVHVAVRCFTKAMMLKMIANMLWTG